MEPLIIEPTEHLLSVSLVAETGKFIFEGRSLPEDAKKFFIPIIKWLEQYALSPASQTECSFKMEYFNSSSRKCFSDVFKVLDAIREKGNAVRVIWFFEEDDEELKEIGEAYESSTDLDFQFLPY
ncbi:MAG: DUF1987 domain-containing protein [Bacteroidetes bacterium]|nr:DUF1987 domain-containing protein [Bacteroidota bacterium]